ncbi:MAG: EamA family transporter [Bacteroidales bacterium]|nr:EamA family transporter [Bacteroidales bacterium]
MKIPLLLLAIVQSALLAGGQVLLKFALDRMLPFGWNLTFWKSVFLNWQFAACGLCYGAGSLLWFYIIKNFPFSMAYPLVSLSYVFGMLAALFIFHEPVEWTKWLGVILIMGGCWFIAR